MRRLFLSPICAVSLLAGLAGCDPPLPPAAFADQKPNFAPEAFFDGHIVAAGIVENRSGQPTGRFTVDNVGHRDGDTLELHQHIVMDTGETRERVWHVKRLDVHNYEGTATDVIGVVHGDAYGNIFHLEYDLALDPGNSLKNVHMQQWMYLQDGGDAMVNRTTVTKLGIVVAELTEYFHRVP